MAKWEASDTARSEGEADEGSEDESEQPQNPEEIRYRNEQVNLSMFVDFDEPRVARPKEMPLGMLAHYTPFLHSLVMYTWILASRAVVGLVVGAVLYGVTSLLVWPVFGAEPVLSSVVGLGTMVWTGGRVFVEGVVEQPWVVWFWVAAGYVVHEYTYQFYLDRMKRDEDAIRSAIVGQVPDRFRAEAVEEWLRPKNRSIHLYERGQDGAPPLWRELALWSGAGLVLGAHVIVVQTEVVSLSYLSDVPQLVVEGAFLLVAALVSRTLTLTMIEDDVRFGEVLPFEAGWRSVARIPLMYALFAYVVGEPYWWGDIASAVVFVFTPVAGMGYVVRRYVWDWYSVETDVDYEWDDAS